MAPERIVERLQASLDREAMNVLWNPEAALQARRANRQAWAARMAASPAVGPSGTPEATGAAVAVA